MESAEIIESASESEENIFDMVQEEEVGPKEYKYHLFGLKDSHRQGLASQMTFRISEGNGEAFYELGVLDNGYALGLTPDELESSIDELSKIAGLAGAVICDVTKSEIIHKNTTLRALRHKHFGEIAIEKVSPTPPPRSVTSSETETETETGTSSGTDAGEASVLDQKPSVPLAPAAPSVPVSKSSRRKKKKSNNGAPPIPEGTCEEMGDVKLYVAEVFVREKFDKTRYIDLKVAVAGNVDAGKSTMIGMLSSGKLDDGDGFTRQYVFNHRHERETGRTSSISQRIIGFDESGRLVNDILSGRRRMTWPDIVTRSSKIITLYDLAGHKDYLSTTIHGIHAYKPDYVIVMMDHDILDMTVEHIIQCIANNVPFIMVMSKIDITPEDKAVKAITTIRKLIGGPGSRKISQVIETEEDVVSCLKHLKEGLLCPIFKVSAVTGEGVGLLKKLLNILPPRLNYASGDSGKIVYEIADKFKSAGHPAITGGTLLKGIVSVGTRLQLGPFSDKSFRETTVRSMELKRVGVETAEPGDYVCLSLSDLVKADIRKGMVLLDLKTRPEPSYYVTVNIDIRGTTARRTRGAPRKRRRRGKEKTITVDPAELGPGKIGGAHSTKVRLGYEPFVHVGSNGESARIVDIIRITRKTQMIYPKSVEEKYLVSRDKAIVVLKFCFGPHIIFRNDAVTFREGRTRGIGYVVCPGTKEGPGELTDEMLKRE